MKLKVHYRVHKAPHLTLSRDIRVQFIFSHSIFLRSILKNLRMGLQVFTYIQFFRSTFCIYFSFLPFVPHTRSSHPSWFYHFNNVSWKVATNYEVPRHVIYSRLLPRRFKAPTLQTATDSKYSGGWSIWQMCLLHFVSRTLKKMSGWSRRETFRTGSCMILPDIHFVSLRNRSKGFGLLGISCYIYLLLNRIFLISEDIILI